MKNSANILFLILSFGLLLAGGTASAEPLLGTGGILDQLYGYENLERIDDNHDQIWFPATGSASVVAMFSDLTQDFGYIPDLNGDNIFDESFVSLFTISATGIDPGNPFVPFSSGNVNFLWALDPSGEPLWTSRPEQNSDTLDHMVTWMITGGSGNTINNFVIAWEDALDGGDRDFNDLVVEVSFNQVPIPEPSSLLLLGTGLFGLAGIARRRKG